MNINTAERLSSVNEYYFATKLKQIDEMNRQDPKVINLGIGSPDLPPHPEVIETLQNEASKSVNHAYQSYRGLYALRKAFADWYNEYYHVNLSSDDEILPLIGSKEGIMHICMTYLNPGDEVLIPDPGYPTYRSAVTLAGGVCKMYDLTEESDWLPDFTTIENSDLGRVKIMILNYPQMPTGKLPTMKLFSQAVDFARRKNILLVHDNPYSFILNNDPISLLAIPEAKEWAVELNSLSKSHNMAGWRIGMVAGKKERINEILRFKSNMDNGMFMPLQMAAVKALSLPPEWYRQLNTIYLSRKDHACEILNLLSCEFDPLQAGMFIWARIPQHMKDGYSVSDNLLEKARVFITPGGIFGKNGRDYLRISLCTPSERFLEAKRRIENIL